MKTIDRISSANRIPADIVTRIVRALGLVSALGCLAPHAYAATVTVNLTGYVTSVSGIAVGNGFFNVGSAINYNLTFEETASLYPASTVDSFSHSVSSFSATVGGYDFAGDNGRAFARNNGVVSGIFGGSPYDQFTLTHNDLARNQTFYFLNRNDFTSSDGQVGGRPLANASLTMQTTDTSFVSGVDFNAAIFQALAANPSYLGLMDFSLYFDTTPVGTVDGLVLGKFTSITVTTVPVPAAMWLLGSGVVGLFGFARRKAA